MSLLSIVRLLVLRINGEECVSNGYGGNLNVVTDSVDAENEPDTEWIRVNELAQRAKQLERFPNKPDWRAWDDRPCSVHSIENEFESWQALWREAGFQPVPLRVSKIIRVTAYQRPDLASHEAEP